MAAIDPTVPVDLVLPGLGARTKSYGSGKIELSAVQQAGVDQVVDGFLTAGKLILIRLADMVQALPILNARRDKFVDEPEFIRGKLKPLARLGDTGKSNRMCVQVIVEPFDLVTGLQQIAGVTDIRRPLQLWTRKTAVIGTDTRTARTVPAMTFMLEGTFFPAAKRSVGTVECIRAVVEVTGTVPLCKTLNMVSSHLPRDRCGMESEKD